MKNKCFFGVLIVCLFLHGTFVGGIVGVQEQSLQEVTKRNEPQRNDQLASIITQQHATPVLKITVDTQKGETCTAKCYSCIVHAWCYCFLSGLVCLNSSNSEQEESKNADK